MKTRIKTLTVCAAALAAATFAGAQNQPRQEKPNRKPAGFNCPVCDSPCINQSAFQRQLAEWEVWRALIVASSTARKAAALYPPARKLARDAAWETCASPPQRRLSAVPPEVRVWPAPAKRFAAQMGPAE